MKATPDELAIILSGRKDPLHALLAANPALAARFPAIIELPGYTPAQLAAIVTTLASEAGLCLTDDAQRKAAAVLAEAEKRHATGNARRAVRLLSQATTSQARRVITASHDRDPAAFATICADDIPGQLPLDDPPSDEQRPGQYL
jgi:hypothetical protein